MLENINSVGVYEANGFNRLNTIIKKDDCKVKYIGDLKENENIKEKG